MDLAQIFRAVLAPDRVRDEAAERRLLASDIGQDAVQLPACVLAPRTEQEVVALVDAARREHIALHPRGGGWS